MQQGLLEQLQPLLADPQGRALLEAEVLQRQQRGDVRGAHSLRMLLQRASAKTDVESNSGCSPPLLRRIVEAERSRWVCGVTLKMDYFERLFSTRHAGSVRDAGCVVKTPFTDSTLFFIYHN